MKPFAVLGGPLLANTWTEELHARGIVCMACPGIVRPGPVVLRHPPQQRPDPHARRQLRRREARRGSPPSSPATTCRTRSGCSASSTLAQTDADEDERRAHGRDPGRPGRRRGRDRHLPARPRPGAGVGDQRHHPMQGGGRHHGDPPGRPDHRCRRSPTRRPSRTGSPSGSWPASSSPTPPRSPAASTRSSGRTPSASATCRRSPAPEITPAYKLYEWYFGEPPPADDSAAAHLPAGGAVLHRASQYAGPDLTVENFRDGIFAFPPTPQRRDPAQPSTTAAASGTRTTTPASTTWSSSGGTPTPRAPTRPARRATASTATSTGASATCADEYTERAQGVRPRGLADRASPTRRRPRSRPTTRRRRRADDTAGRNDVGASAPTSLACRAMVEAAGRRYVVRTYGCQMNEHDSERIAGLLEAEGMTPGRRPRRRRRRRPQHLLHPRERRQQALRQPRPPQVPQGPQPRPADRRRRLPRPEGPGRHRRAGAPRRRRVRHPQRAPGRRPAHRAARRRAGGRRDPRRARRRRPRRVRQRPACPPRAALRRLGHDPGRLRQLLRLLHRPRRAGPRDQPVRRRHRRARCRRWPPTGSPR